jgi:hypothetical protein
MRMPIWLTMLVGAAAVVFGCAGEVNAQEVRALRLAPPRPPMTIFTFAGKKEMTVFPDAEAIAKLMGADAATSLVDAVDFRKEKIVLISWITTGPPEGTLNYEVKKGTIEFYMQGPGGGPRNQRSTYGASFFAVPRDAEVVFDPKER